jgi:hypothetical protein
MFSLDEFLQNKTWNPTIVDGPNGKKILCMRLQMKPGTTANQIKITLNGFDLRVEVGDSPSSGGAGATCKPYRSQLNLLSNFYFLAEHSYRQVTLFPTCEAEQIKTELKNDGFLHIKVPIKL